MLVGRLIYISHTRPDIAYAVRVVSQFKHDLGKEHMQAVQRTVRYLKYTCGSGIILQPKRDLSAKGYTVHVMVDP